MQINTPASRATAPAPPSGRLSNDLATTIPREILDAPLGEGTVGSHLERSIRVRLEGDAPASQRELVSETYGAADLLQSEKGSAFERAVRSFTGVADAWKGSDDLKTVTLYPDEFAVAAGGIADEIDLIRAHGGDPAQLVTPPRAMVAALQRKIPDAPRDLLEQSLRTTMAQRWVRDAAADVPADVRFSAARNLRGHIAVMPDVSRDILSTLGLYTQRAGDATADRASRGANTLASRLAEGWKTLVHETHHSVTPTNIYDDESVAVFEEAVSSVLERLQGDAVAAQANAKITDTATKITTQGPGNVRDAVDWQPWNRAHLPEPPKSLTATSQGRYIDGPELVAKTLTLAGVDLQSAEGAATAARILQQDPAEHVADNLAAEVVAHHRINPALTPALARMLTKAATGRDSFDAITAFIASLSKEHT